MVSLFCCLIEILITVVKWTWMSLNSILLWLTTIVVSQQVKKSMKQQKLTTNVRPAQRMSIPSAQTIKYVKTSPMFNKTPKGLIINHKEIVATGLSNNSNLFMVSSFPCNPGLVNSFPWLSGVANSFERYTIRKLRFNYVPQIGTSQSGTIAMCLDPNCLDSIPLSRSEMLQKQFSARGPAWAPLSLDIPTWFCLERAKLFTRSGEPLGTHYDLKTYDFGKFFISCGETTISDFGDLEVEYIVELMVPQKDNGQTTGFYEGTFSVPSKPSDLAHESGPDWLYIYRITPVTTLELLPAVAGRYLILIESDLSESITYSAIQRTVTLLPITSVVGTVSTIKLYECTFDDAVGSALKLTLSSGVWDGTSLVIQVWPY